MDQPHDTGAPNGGHEQVNPQHIDCIRCGYNLHGQNLGGNCPECGLTVGSTLGIDCLRCGYNLHGLTMGGNCPECGTPVAHTIHGNLLRHSSPDYLDKLQRGLKFVVISYILSLVAIIIQIPLAFMVGFSPTSSSNDLNMLLIVLGVGATAIGLIIGILSLVGWWWVSQPDPDFIGEDSADSTRTTLRVLVAALAVVMLLHVPVNFLYWTSDSVATDLASSGMSLITALISIAMFFVSLLYMRVIARRIPHRELMLQTGQYLWLLPVIYIVGACLIVGPIIATVMYVFLLWRVRKQLVILQEQQALALQPVV